MKPLWYVEKDAFGWTINCRFMLGGKRAGVSHLVPHWTYHYSADCNDYLAGIIQYITDRRDTFIAEEAA